MKFSSNSDRTSKYPVIGYDYESKDYSNLYFAGTVTHSLDFRKSSGGWILNWIIKNNLFYFIKINLTLALFMDFDTLYVR